MKYFKTYYIDPMSASWTYRYPLIKMVGLFVNNLFIIKLVYLIKGYPAFNKEKGILRCRFF